MMEKQSLEMMGVFVDAADTLFVRSTQHPGGWRLADESELLLKAFAQRRIGSTPIRTGIITNWGRSLLQRVQEHGLADYFDALIYVRGFGHMKPDPEFFHLAAAEVQLNPSQCFHVGDSLEGDARGASRAGFTGVWLSPIHAAEKIHSPAVRTLNAYAELLSQKVESCANPAAQGSF